MYIKVRILIGVDGISVDGISPQEVTAPVGIRYKGRRPQPSREKLGSILTETFRIWLNLVGVASVYNA